MSKRSFKTCNTEAQKLRWRIKVCKKKLFRSWCDFNNGGGKIKDAAFHWARMKRCLLTLEYSLQRLADPERTKEVMKKVGRLLRKMEKFEPEYNDITAEYGSKKKEVRKKEYTKTAYKHLRKFSG